MSIENVRAALDGILSDWATANSVPVAWENLATGSALSAPYVMPFLLPVETVGVGLAIGDNQDFTGIYQISVYTEKGKGTKASRDIVNSLIEAYARGAEVEIPVTGGVQKVLIEMSSAAPALDGDAWYTVPVSVRYRSFA